MFSLPSRGRPWNFARFVGAYLATSASVPVWVRLDEDDETLGDYAKVRIPSNWRIDVGPRLPNRCNGAVAEMFERFPHEAVYGLLADDLLPMTPRWDAMLVSAAERGYLAYGDDGLQGKALATHPVLGGDLVRAIGWLVLPGVLHSFVDTALFAIACRAGRARYLQHVHVEHLHPIAGKAPMDAVYRFNETFEADRAVFERWARDELPGVVDRVRSALLASDVAAA